jgi:hypothetical protein
MAISRRRILLAGLPMLIVALALGSAYVLWARLTRPVADSRRATLAVLPAGDPAANTGDLTDTVDVEPHEMPRIEPGSEIAASDPRGEIGAGEPSTKSGAIGTATDAPARAPADWSHLVLHGVPRVAEGDVDKVPASLARLVSLFHLTILADVAADESVRPARYRLRNVAIGLATDVAGHEKIVTSKTLGSLGSDFGFVERSSLAGNEACLDQALQVARTPTMLVFDATAIQRLDDQNRHVLHRHALVVSPTNGSLATFVWALARDNADREQLVDDKIRLLPDGLEEDRKLYVDSALFVLGLPAQEAFALVDLPPGRDVAVSAELRASAAAAMTKPEDALRLERLLRAALTDMSAG